MIAGLALQVASLTLYLGLCIDFGFRVYSNFLRSKNLQGEHEEQEAKSNNFLQSTEIDNVTTVHDIDLAELRHSKTWNAFLILQGLAIVCIYIRCIFRVAELKGGFDSGLAQDQTKYMVLEGTMISIAVIALSTWGHPGVGFKGLWGNMNYRMFARKRKQQQEL